MRYIVVNDRHPREDACCGFCCEPIGEGYVRELGTRILYCDHTHYSAHVESSVLAIEYHARQVS
jgi:hypothetical protein